MKIRTIVLLTTTAALAAACGPQPGSAEWCKGVLEGKIQASQAESEAHGPKCVMSMMQDAMKGLQLPNQ